MARKIPTLEVESQLWQQGLLKVVGVDEVGRGCLSGPVVAAAVLLPPYCSRLPGVCDSKQLTPAQRLVLFQLIRQQALTVGVGLATVTEIDQINILQATYRAMQRALSRIGSYDHALIDGRPIKQVGMGSYTAIVDGDASSYAIACASIIAKVRRDRFMQRLAQRYPGYGWERNAGYGTKEHLTALQKLGVTPWHRLSFAPVRQLQERQQS